MNDYLLRVSLCCGLLGLMSACASTPKLTHEHLESHIFTNGNKQFTYSVQVAGQHKRSGAKGERRGGGKPRGKSNGEGHQRPSKGSGSRGSATLSPKLEASAIVMLEAKLQALEYCREGYLLLERAIKRGKVVLKGECNELASADDKKHYPNTKSDVVRGSTFPEFEML